MKKLLQVCSNEIEVKRSRFLAECFPVSSQNEVREILKSQKEKYSSARHVVHAFVLGRKKEIVGASDDGEPSGTAGQPVLTVLKNQDISFVLVTITRWFGGILLGTGGLVKAYTQACKDLLVKAEESKLIVQDIETVVVRFSLEYAQYSTIKSLLETLNFQNEHINFSSKVEVKGELPFEDLPKLEKALTNVTKGEVKVVVQK